MLAAQANLFRDTQLASSSNMVLRGYEGHGGSYSAGVRERTPTI
jgi:hypothetical protein